MAFFKKTFLSRYFSNESQTNTESTENIYEHQEVNDPRAYEDLKVIKALSQVKFSVYLVYSQIKNQYYAIKFFGFENDNPNPLYKNEARFADLNHPNIIKILHTKDQALVPSNGKQINVSSIIMEYAPYGDLFDLINKAKQDFTEKLARTYFRQLIEGLEYLHQKGVCHLDIRLDNLLIGNNCQLKISDFDLSCLEGDSVVLTKGTKFFRAPELIEGKVTPAVDIYSAGIVLFAMKNGGTLPHAEEGLCEGINLFELLKSDREAFFKKHCELRNQEDSFFSKDFRELFTSMVEIDKKKRATIKEIKNSKWYKGSVFSEQELKGLMSKFINC